MLTHLLDVSIRATVLYLVAAGVQFLLPKRRSAALVHAIWTAVVCGMLALFLFGQYLPKVPLRILNATPQATPVAFAAPRDLPRPLAALRATNESALIPATIPSPLKPEPGTLDGTRILTWAWGAIALAFLAQFLTGLLLVRRLLARSVPCAVAPRAYETDAINVPMTVGLFAPRILLPATYREWDREKRDAVLTHETAHIRRRDTLLSAIAALNRCIFWFHPLAWILERKLAFLAEQACDESSVAALGDRDSYARLLIEMALVVDSRHGRLRCHALTMAARSHLGRRVESLLREQRHFSRGLTRAAWFALVLCGVPILWSAGTVELGHQPALLRLDMPHWVVPAPPATVLAQSSPAPAAAPTARPVAEPSLRFEAVSVKPAPGCVQPRPGAFPNGRLTLPCLTARNLIQVSYGTYGAIRNPRIQIVEGPAWYTNDKFNVEGKAEDPNATPTQMFGPMIRALLADRFALKTHMEFRDEPVYTLTIAKNGMKIKPTPAGTCDPAFDYSKNGLPLAPGQPRPLRPCGSGSNIPNGASRTVETYGANIADFLHASIFMYLDRPVIDKTGLTGLYDYHLEFSTPSPQQTAADLSDPSGVSIFTAFQDQLGLKLTADTGPVEVLVIDHIEKPTEN